nr:hypothetical protein [Mycobacterium asiaticum]
MGDAGNSIAEATTALLPAGADETSRVSTSSSCSRCSTVARAAVW